MDSRRSGTARHPRMRITASTSCRICAPGPGAANDGRPKYDDLTQFNPLYFERLAGQCAVSTRTRHLPAVDPD